MFSQFSLSWTAVLLQSSWTAVLFYWLCASVLFESVASQNVTKLECSWPEWPNRLEVIDPLAETISAQRFDAAVFRVELHAPATVTATWWHNGIEVNATDEIRLRRESEVARPCWHAFSVKLEKSMKEHGGEWTVKVHYNGESRTAGITTLTINEPLYGYCGGQDSSGKNTLRCENGGTCVKLMKDENSIMCPDGDCIDHDAPWPCIKRFKCVCPDNYRGEHCELYCGNSTLVSDTTRHSRLLVNLTCPLDKTLRECPAGGTWYIGDKTTNSTTLHLKQVRVLREDAVNFTCKVEIPDTKLTVEAFSVSVQVQYAPYVNVALCKGFYYWPRATFMDGVRRCPVMAGVPSDHRPPYNWTTLHNKTDCYGICTDAVTKKNSSLCPHPPQAKRGNYNCAPTDAQAFEAGILKPGSRMVEQMYGMLLSTHCGGCYECSSENEFGSASFQFYIKDLTCDQSPFITSQPVPYEHLLDPRPAKIWLVPQGETVVFTIKLPSPDHTSLLWYFNGSYLTESNKSYTFSSSKYIVPTKQCWNEYNLTVHNVSREDTGAYKMKVQLSPEFGLWLDFNITLKLLCPRPATGPHLQVSGDLVGTNGFRPGTSVMYLCNYGYQLEGNYTSVCLKNGSWSTPPPSCAPLHCPQLIAPPNSKKMTLPTVFNVSNIVQFECLENFFVNGSQTVLCGPDQKWNASVPRCDPVSCVELKAEASVTILSQNTSFQGIIRCECSTGYHKVQGDTTRVCQQNGQWNGLKLLCQDYNECVNGEHSCASQATCDNTIGNYKCQCLQGFTGNGTVCRAEGNQLADAKADGSSSNTLIFVLSTSGAVLIIGLLVLARRLCLRCKKHPNYLLAHGSSDVVGLTRILIDDRCSRLTLSHLKKAFEGKKLLSKHLYPLGNYLADHWKVVATSLNVQEDFIRACDHNYPRECQKSAQQMLVKWHFAINATGHNWTVGQLCSVLEQCMLKGVCEEWLMHLVKDGELPSEDFMELQSVAENDMDSDDDEDV